MVVVVAVISFPVVFPCQPQCLLFLKAKKDLVILDFTGNPGDFFNPGKKIFVGLSDVRACSLVGDIFSSNNVLFIKQEMDDAFVIFNKALFL